MELRELSRLTKSSNSEAPAERSSYIHSYTYSNHTDVRQISSSGHHILWVERAEVRPNEPEWAASLACITTLPHDSPYVGRSRAFSLPIDVHETAAMDFCEETATLTMVVEDGRFAPFEGDDGVPDQTVYVFSY